MEHHKPRRRGWTRLRKFVSFDPGRGPGTEHRGSLFEDATKIVQAPQTRRSARRFRHGPKNRAGDPLHN
eukprot:1314619-Pyramimonas_sp.AAC.1